MTSIAPVSEEMVGGSAGKPDTLLPGVDIALPVHNAAATLEAFLRRTSADLSNLNFSFILTVVDCASSDRTLAIAEKVAREIPSIRVLHLEHNVPAAALKYAWETSQARVLVQANTFEEYRAADLEALIAAVVEGKAQVAVGIAEGTDEYTEHGMVGALWRGLRNTALRTFTGNRYAHTRSDLLAIRTECARTLLPYTGELDGCAGTELIILAQRAGLAMTEVPVKYISASSII